MSLSYSNLPVYVGEPSASTVSETLGYIPATQVNVNYTTNSSPKRNLGVSIATGDQFKFGQGLNTTVSMTCFLQKDFEEGMSWTYYNDDFFPIKIGNNIFKKCYVNDFSVSVAPYQPVTVQATFTCLDPPTGMEISGDENPYGGGNIDFRPDQIVYGHSCSVTNMNTVVSDTQSQVSYQKRITRTPVFKLGSINASTMLLDGVEEQMTITSTGLNNLIDFSGDILNNEVKVDLTSLDGNEDDYLGKISMAKGATVAIEGYSVGQADTVQTTATIKQVTV